MCSINFVREFGLMMEEARKVYLGCRERMLWIALFYIANDRAKYNPQTQTYDWPMGFFQISHQELDLYCKLPKKAVLELRNHLKQRGYIDFTKGERNAEKPMYKLNYLSFQDFGGENAPKDGPNTPPKDTPKDGPNTSPKDTPKGAPFYNKYKYGEDTGKEQEGGPRKARFTPPTVEEVAAYCRKSGIKINAKSFCSFYASNGWRVGKNPMEDWKASVMAWEEREKNGRTGKKVSAQDYEQRNYTEEELLSISDDLIAEARRMYREDTA